MREFNAHPLVNALLTYRRAGEASGLTQGVRPLGEGYSGRIPELPITNVPLLV